MQRLYSTFASGWPGLGLLLQRIVTTVLLVHFCVVRLTDSPFSVSVIPHIIGACGALFLLVGLWTPAVGALIAVIELWAAVAHLNDPWLSVLLATIGGSSAMLGPGAYSIDARLYGRRHLEV